MNTQAAKIGYLIWSDMTKKLVIWAETSFSGDEKCNKNSHEAKMTV